MGVLGLYRLDGRVGIVTGAGWGLGADFAVALAEAGADVVLAARRADRLATTAAAVEAAGRRALVVPADVADPDQCGVLAAVLAELMADAPQREGPRGWRTSCGGSGPPSEPTRPHWTT